MLKQFECLFEPDSQNRDLHDTSYMHIRTSARRGMHEGGGCATCREDARVACYWSRQKGDEVYPYIYIYTRPSWVFFARSVGTLKWNKLEIFKGGRGWGDAFSLCMRERANPSLSWLWRISEGANARRGALRFDNYTIAVLTHLSLSFIAQFDIKRQRYTVVSWTPNDNGDDFLIAFMARPNVARLVVIPRGWVLNWG